MAEQGYLAAFQATSSDLYMRYPKSVLIAFVLVVVIVTVWLFHFVFIPPPPKKVTNREAAPPLPFNIQNVEKMEVHIHQDGQVVAAAPPASPGSGTLAQPAYLGHRILRELLRVAAKPSAELQTRSRRVVHRRQETTYREAILTDRARNNSDARRLFVLEPAHQGGGWQAVRGDLLGVPGVHRRARFLLAAGDTESKHPAAGVGPLQAKDRPRAYRTVAEAECAV